MADAVRSMTTLNDGAARAALQGRRERRHRRDRIRTDRAPHQHAGGEQGGGGDRLRCASRSCPHARNLASRGVVPGGTERNFERRRRVEWAPDLGQADRYLCVDAQTSGGLLLAVPPENEAALLAAWRGAHSARGSAASAGKPGISGSVSAGCPRAWLAHRI